MIAYSYNKILYWDYQGFVTCVFEWLTLLSWQHFLLELRRGKGWNTALCVESLHFSQLKTYPLEHNILEFQTPCFESNNGKWICVVFVRSTEVDADSFPWKNHIHQPRSAPACFLIQSRVLLFSVSAQRNVTTKNMTTPLDPWKKTDREPPYLRTNHRPA